MFVLNFSRKPAAVALPAGTDVLTGESVGGETELAENGVKIIKVQE